MQIYQLFGEIEWEGCETLMIANSFDKALNSLVTHLEKCVYLGNVDGYQTVEGPNVFRHFRDYTDFYTIREVTLNEFIDRHAVNSKTLFKISRYGSFGYFTKSSAFYQGKRFSVPLLKSWNEITD